jgi:hypothetical protein
MKCVVILLPIGVGVIGEKQIKKVLAPSFAIV